MTEKPFGPEVKTPEDISKLEAIKELVGAYKDYISDYPKAESRVVSLAELDYDADFAVDVIRSRYGYVTPSESFRIREFIADEYFNRWSNVSQPLYEEEHPMLNDKELKTIKLMIERGFKLAESDEDPAYGAEYERGQSEFTKYGRHVVSEVIDHNDF